MVSTGFMTTRKPTLVRPWHGTRWLGHCGYGLRYINSWSGFLPPGYNQACADSMASSDDGSSQYGSLECAQQMHHTLTTSPSYGDVLRTDTHHLGPSRMHTFATTSHSTITSLWHHDGVWYWSGQHVYDLYVPRSILWLFWAAIGPPQVWHHETSHQRPEPLQIEWTSLHYLNRTGIASSKDAQLANTCSRRMVDQVGWHCFLDHRGCQESIIGTSGKVRIIHQLLFAHPEIWPNLLHNGLPIVLSAPFSKVTHNQLNNQ